MSTTNSPGAGGVVVSEGVLGAAVAGVLAGLLAGGPCGAGLTVGLTGAGVSGFLALLLGTAAPGGVAIGAAWSCADCWDAGGGGEACVAASSCFVWRWLQIDKASATSSRIAAKTPQGKWCCGTTALASMRPTDSSAGNSGWMGGASPLAFRYSATV